MWKILDYAKNIVNKVRKENEQRRYRDLHLVEQIKCNGNYCKIYDCHVIIFDNQGEMLEKGILKKGLFNVESEIVSKQFDEWLSENLNGYYDVWKWGNGRSNPGQRHYGIWRIEIRCMRAEDATLIKLVWG